MFRYEPYWTAIEHFRALYETIIALEPDAVAQYLAGKGQEAARPLMCPLEPYRRRNSTRNPYVVNPEHLWDLYALSRVSDHLLLAFQTFDASAIGSHTLRAIAELLPPVEIPVPESGSISPEELMRLLDAPRPSPTRDEIAGCFPCIGEDDYVRFFEVLGFERHSEPTFSPYYHEIVQVEETAVDSAAVEIVRQFWPGLLYGELMFARAGVGVRCSSQVIAKAIAEQSTLYWAHRRLRRPTNDLSVGWGHNSQWRTAFRRDYAGDEHCYYNVDGDIDIGRSAEEVEDPFGYSPSAPKYALSVEERRELLIHRCFVKSTPPDTGVWPWDDTLALERSQPPWPL